MGHGIATIEIRRKGSELIVNALGRTPRGQRYIKNSRTLTVSSLASSGAKAEFARAVNEMMAQQTIEGL